MKMSIKTVMPTVLTAAILWVSGCGSPPPQAGFLSDYSRLEADGKTRLAYFNANAAKNYKTFIIDPIKVHYHGDAKAAKEQAKGKITQEDLDDIRNYMRDSLIRTLREGGYGVVYRPASGVARLRIAITDLKKSTPILNIIPQTKLTGLGLGAASMEAELVDSQTGKQIGAVIQSQSGNMLSFDGIKTWGDAKGVIDDWADRFRDKLDKIHGE